MNLRNVESYQKLFNSIDVSREFLLPNYCVMIDYTSYL